MARIRTIKPEFFKHEGIFDAEHATGLPLRLAFAGLWTQCDREGRFAWRPRQLKVDILPYDDVDFSRVLDALATRGFIVKYASNGREYGCIPSWHRHQVINNRERDSEIPEPTEIIEVSDASSTRDARVGHAGKAEGKGKEGKGTIEPNGSLSETSSDEVQKPRKRESYPDDFEAFWESYPRTPNMSKKEAYDAWKKLGPADRENCSRAVPGYVAFLKSKPDLEIIHACRFISKRRFDGYAEIGGAVVTAVDEKTWRSRLRYGRRLGKWSIADWGPLPGAAGCRAPGHLLEPGDGNGWTEMERAA
ncbi:hypothetical protein [Rhizobium mayense]|uniref:Helix-turn-helix domain-containing protein n=1 Tax=Rhizobium mayense TaxID=1312184 RepID=A0ABT7K2C7_9HYPH|nr:hypothetical protein [Rhizobium mayense]MDL2401573.1 hypothetical protein [Rhizobium mayense]